jgi:hypothetical protein
MRTKARETRLAPFAAAPEKRLEATVYAPNGVAGELDRQIGQGRHPLAHGGQQGTLPVVPDGLATSPVRLDPVFKALVVQPAARPHPGRNGFFLSAGGVQFHFDDAEHGKKDKNSPQCCQGR